MRGLGALVQVMLFGDPGSRMGHGFINEKLCLDTLSHLIHRRLTDPFVISNTKIGKYVRTTSLDWLVGHARHEMYMHMRMVGGLGKLDDVGFETSGCRVECARHTLYQETKFCCFSGG